MQIYTFGSKIIEMTQQNQIKFKLTRCDVVFGLLLLLGIPRLPASGAQLLPSNALDNNELVQQLSSRNLNFAFKIYKLMADQDDAVLSPFCISVALTMTSFGARNNTLKQMNNALDLNGFQDHMQIAKAYNSILKSLDLKGDITLAISNRILIDKSYHIKETFRDIVVNEFRAVAQSVNFLDNDQTLNKEINQGLDQLALNKFKKLPSLGREENSMGAVLVSAIYFKGKWAQQFRQESTKPEEFLMANKMIQMVPMMNSVAQFYYAEDARLGSKILKLESSGSRLVTYFILPNRPRRLKVLRESLTAEWFRNLKNSLRLKTVAVKLPKINCNYMKELSPELRNLNIYDLENEVSVDLNEIAEPQASGSRLFVQKVLYAADVEMGEEGTEAVAKPALGQGSATGLGSGSGAGSGSASGIGLAASEKPAEFFAVRPFVFIIYDTATNFILFIGNVDNPKFT